MCRVNHKDKINYKGDEQMKVQGPEQVLAMQLLTECMKKTMGDSPAFDIVMQSLTQSVEDNPNDNILSSLVGQTVGDDSSEQTLDLNNLGNSSITPNSLISNKTISGDTSLTKDERINNAISMASQKYGVDGKLIRAVIKQESDFNPEAVSSAGAMGLMQLMPANCKEDGVTDPLNIEQNIDGGTKQLKGYLNKYKSVEMSLMAYNAGPGTVQRRGVQSINDLYKMPAETRNYVAKVMNYYNG